MIGKICTSTTPFYDCKSQKNSFKSRPVLIIAGPRNDDYTILPISTISKKENVDHEYDIPLSIKDYPLLNLKQDCYIRTHKQTTVHKKSIIKELSSLKDTYEDLYLNVFCKLEEYNKHILDNAI